MKKQKLLAIAMILCLVMVLMGCQNPIDKLLGDGSETTDVNYMLQEEGFFSEEEDGLRKTVLYYKDQQGLVIPVMRSIPWEEGIAQSALHQLVDRPAIREDLSMIGLLPVLPAGTEVIGMAINEGLCRVDFNKNLLSYNSELEEKTILQSIVYTLTEFEAIDQVQIMVEGEALEKLTYGTKLTDGLERQHINIADSLSQESLPVTVYYKGTVNGEDTFFVPVTKGVNALKVDVKSALVALLEGVPDGSGLYSEIPIGTSVNDVYVREGIAYIDLTEEIKRIPENAQHQQSLVYELGLTLKEIEPSIAQVRILSNGTEIQLDPNVSLNLPEYSNKY